MFIGIAPIIGVIVSTAISVASTYLVSALSRPKQDEKEGRIPGSAIGRNIPEGFNYFVIDDVRWIEPSLDSRAFVSRGKDKLYFTGIGAIAGCKGGCDIQKLWLAGKKEYDLGGDTNFIDREVVFNPGLPDQNPVEWQEENWGNERPKSDYVAYLNIATIGFYSLGVHKRGLSAPSVRLVLKSRTNYTVGSICRKKAIDAGIADSSIDTSEIDSEPCRGFSCDRNGNSYYQQIEPLLVNHFVGVIERSNGQLKFKKIAREDITLNIPLEHLGTRKEGETLESLISREFTDTRDLPKSIIFNFIDSGDDNLSDFEQSSVESEFHPKATNNRIENISTDELLSRPEAKIIANKTLYQIWERSIIYEFSLPFDYKTLIEPLDIVTIDNVYTVQIDSMILTADFRIKVKAYQYKPASLEYSTSGVNAIATPVSNTPPATAPDTSEAQSIATGEITLLDCPLVFNEDTEVGLYAFANYTGDLYLSRDDGSTYGTVIAIEETANYGLCQSILGYENVTINSNTYPINTNLESNSLPILDTTNTLTVSATNGTITSLTQSEFDNESVLIFVGKQTSGIWEGELICANIAVQSGNSIILSDFRRGLRGTESYIDKHTSGESWFLINSSTPRISLNQSDFNNQLFYKFQVSDIQNLEAIASKSITVLNQGIISYSPTDLSYTEDSSGNITFVALNRSRLGLLQTGEQNKIELDLLDSVNAVARTLSGTSLKYSQSQQTADGLTAPFKINAYRINSVVGRSSPSYFREIQLGSSISFLPLENSVYKGIKTLDSTSQVVYTLIPDDQGLYLKFDTAIASIDLTLPDNLDIGFYCTLRNLDNGTINTVNLVDTNGFPLLIASLSAGDLIDLFYNGTEWESI